MPKKYQMAAADLAIASRCYKQGRTPHEVVECLRMQRARISIWFDSKLGAWVIQDCDGAMHKLENINTLPALLEAQHHAPGTISQLSGDTEGETIKRHVDDLARIEAGLVAAAENRKRGIASPLNRANKPKPVVDLGDLFADLL